MEAKTMKAANLIRRIKLLMSQNVPVKLFSHLTTALEECIAEHFEGIGD